MKLQYNKIKNGIEEIICSVSVFRIIKEMAKSPSKQYTKYILGKNTMLNQRDITYGLKKLIFHRWVMEEKHGRLRVYKLNIENKTLIAFMEFLKKAEII